MHRLYRRPTSRYIFEPVSSGKGKKVTVQREKGGREREKNVLLFLLPLPPSRKSHPNNGLSRRTLLRDALCARWSGYIYHTEHQYTTGRADHFSRPTVGDASSSDGKKLQWNGFDKSCKAKKKSYLSGRQIHWHAAASLKNDTYIYIRVCVNIRLLGKNWPQIYGRPRITASLPTDRPYVAPRIRFPSIFISAQPNWFGILSRTVIMRVEILSCITTHFMGFFFGKRKKKITKFIRGTNPIDESNVLTISLVL